MIDTSLGAREGGAPVVLVGQFRRMLRRTLTVDLLHCFRDLAVQSYLA